MSRHESRLPDYLEHMADALQRVLDYTVGKSEADFLSDRMLQDAVMRNLGVLGEAANNCFKVSPNVAVRFPNVPFAKVYGLRNQLTHGYTTVDMATVWNIVENDVPELRIEIVLALDSLQNPPE